MPSIQDGPSSPLFRALRLEGNATLPKLSQSDLSEEMRAAVDHAPRGSCVGWGIPFEIEQVVVISGQAVWVNLEPVTTRWLVFMHTSDIRPIALVPEGFPRPLFSRDARWARRDSGHVQEHAADYVVLYEDGSEERVCIRRRRQVGPYIRPWGENCFEAVPQVKANPLRASLDSHVAGWGRSQVRVRVEDEGPWVNWLWAWENPHPEKAIAGVRFEPVSGAILVSAISAGDVSSLPLRWGTRRKAVLTLPEREMLCPELDDHGNLAQIRLDLGVVISAQPRLVYPKDRWPVSYENQLPVACPEEVVVEYTAHPDALFTLPDGGSIPVAEVEGGTAVTPLRPVRPASQRVRIRVVEQQGGSPVPVKLHVHGEWGEYLAPTDRHRIINDLWFEDYSVDYLHHGVHACTYIPGETTIDLPLGQVYVEITKGFEIRPVRRVVEVTPETTEITIQLHRVLPWRERGWVTADTHVHFLSPVSALLEGTAEGVNIVNLLAAQWGELQTNVGDFDGRTTWGSQQAGGNGEYLVRVGTENRQHVLGHISLLGYEGSIIAPMSSAGPNEAPLGDPVGVLLTEWARQCKAQGGLAVLPHFPGRRAEQAASIVSGSIDALEMTSWGATYGGINPYSLLDWYRFLNCGYLVAAVGGTDKMSANTAVGTVRTYARIPAGQPFTYESWKEAVRRAETFATYGPLVEFAVDGHPMGSRIQMSTTGGTVNVTWEVASVTVPMTRVELILNGEIRESVAVPPDEAAGHWSVTVDRSSWLVLMVRGHYPDKAEIIAAHSSPVMISVERSRFFAAADALTILEQIEGSIAYVDTIGTRAEDAAYKRMRLVLESAHRTLHNRMHQRGTYHEHTISTDHPEHH
jgi:hypothetical protein